MLRGLIATPVLFLIPALAQAQFRPQWMMNSRQHRHTAVEGPPLDPILADIVNAPTVPHGQAATGGDLLAH